MITPAIEKFLDKIIQLLKDDTIKKKIQIQILQPFIQYLIELVFPYFIIMCVVFAIIIVMITSILYLLLIQGHSSSASL
jgi:hypothetical protein